MTTPVPMPDRRPMIGVVDRAHRELRADMLREAHARGHAAITLAHNHVFATLPLDGARAADMAARAGITRQSMGELLRELVGLGILEMRPDPTDGRAKIVTYTEQGREFRSGGNIHIIEMERRLVEEFGADDCEATRRVLDGLVAMLREDAPPASAPTS